MKRRIFIRNTALATVGMVAAPYILPSGRLFAATGRRIADHVVLVLFAGGLRNQESVDQRYLNFDPQEGQGTSGSSGNIMYNMLKSETNDAPSSGIYNPWPRILPVSLQEQGTLFKEVRYRVGPPAHFNAHAVAMTGKYMVTGLNEFSNPPYPTLFEYYRKESNPQKNALNAWWMANQLGAYPALNYSDFDGYGSLYGANHLSPATTFGKNVNDFLCGLNLGSDESKINKVKGFLNNNFSKSPSDLPGIQQTEEERYRIKQFIIDTSCKDLSGQWPTPTGSEAEMIGDLYNVAYSWEVLKEFKPELTVINTTNLDVCHDDFPGYIQNTHKADYGIGWLWDKIQSDPVLGGNTIMICMPEHGRNLEPNSLVENGIKSYDHTVEGELYNGETENSRRIFSLVVGKGVKAQSPITTLPGGGYAESVDIVKTIGEILGFSTPHVEATSKSLVTYFS